MKISTLITVMAASAMILCGCGESNSEASNSEASKAELKERFIKKYSRYIPEEHAKALLGEGNVIDRSHDASAAIIYLTKKGLADELEADLDAYYNAAE